ncbi:MAG: family 10 glycosylhydrolase [Fimbriimonadaceae bacterium]|nr:family 10 glycosylhydrolase [Fimbriimonadaceae bacterium]
MATWTGLSLLLAVAAETPRPWIEVRGIYGGVPREWLADGGRLADRGVNAVWIGAGGINDEAIATLRAQGCWVFAEFNTLHEAGYLKEHPDAAPVGVDGQPASPPHDWQGVAPTHAGYRRYRMEAFRALLRRYPVDGVWLDYHHSQASWERDVPALPDTGFEPYTLAKFQADTGLALPAGPVAEVARLLLTTHRERWTQWRCDQLTDWVREFRAILDAERPGALLGTFHCPWTDRDYDGALREKLHIDLRAQAPYLDVLSPMPYHARFGHAGDPAWIARQTAWLGEHLGLRGAADERLQIWPIVQLADWGEPVAAAQVPAVVEAATRPPARGVLIFHWSGLASAPAKGEALASAYRQLRAGQP